LVVVPFGRSNPVMADDAQIFQPLAVRAAAQPAQRSHRVIDLDHRR